MATSTRKIEANRANARKSTGPRTEEGKARAARNALRHGILAATPVLREVERTEEWNAHAEGMRASLAPVGYLEELLTDRAATLAWRMGRVARYERETLSASMEAVPGDIAGDGLNWTGGNPEFFASRLDRASRALRLLERVADHGDAAHGERVDAESAEWALFYMDEALPLSPPSKHGGKEEPLPSIPGVPNEEEGREEFDGWTVGLVWGALEAYGRASKRDAEGVLRIAVEAAQNEEAAVLKERREFRAEVERRQGARLLLPTKIMECVLRYETTMERAFLRTLHELQRIQAGREGGSVLPPVAVDVSLSGPSDGGYEG